MFLCALLAWPSPADAAPSPAERETARDAMDEGDRLRSAGDLRGALERFMAAHELMRLPTTGLEVALLQAQLGMLVEARQTALDAAQLPPAADERPALARARRSAQQLADEIAPRVPSLSTRVTPADADYKLTVDGVELSDAARALPFKSNPGEHEIVVSAPGYRTIAQRVMLLEGSDRMLLVTLTPVTPEPGAAAVAQVEATAPAHEPAPGSVQTVTLSPAPPDPAADARLRAIIALSAGGAVLAAGVVSGIASMTETGNIKARCERDACPRSAWQDVGSANTLANVANVTIPLGLLGIGYGLYELLTLPSNPSSERASDGVTLSVHPGGAHASWRGAL